MTITSDRGRLTAVINLIAWQQPGSYQLPADVLAAVDVYTAAKALPIPEPAPLRFLEDAAAQAVDSLTRGETPDPLALAGAVADGNRQADQAESTKRLVAIATEQAAARAIATTSASSAAIIAGCLQPAFADVLDQARRHAPALRDYRADSGWDAPPKARAARGAMVDVAARYRALQEARAACVGLGGVEPAHDTVGQFSLLREPQALVPGYTPNRPLPPPDLPRDTLAAVLWLVTVAEPATPWLPTVAEQDEAWRALFGEAQQRLQAGAMSARANSGASV